MTPQDLAARCDDTPDSPYISYAAFDIDAVRRDLDTDGFSIVRGLIPQAQIPKIRDYWLNAFKKAPQGRVTWSPYMGQENHWGFSSDAFQYLFRACDFLWNEPLDATTREVALRMHALRNLLINRDPAYGTRFTDGRYGMFVAASYYPAGEGMMDEHDDGVADEETLIHCLAPFTFSGTDYAEGGMVLTDRHGVRHELEPTLMPGDVVFYDGALKHGVLPIKALPGKSTGRLQISPLPTRFTALTNNPRALSTIPLSRFARAYLARAKNTARISLGMRPGMR